MGSQQSLFGDGDGGSDPGSVSGSVTGPGLDVLVVRGALAPTEADAAFATLTDEVPWRQEHLRMFGELVAVPRLEAWVADEGLDYTYSGIEHVAQPWSPTLAALRARMDELADASFNSVLCNLYRDGNDGVDWHADDEVEFGRRPVIASLSLGATRRFDLRRVDDTSIRVDLELHHGDLVVMRGTTQELWRHRVPRTKRPVGPRINLTFRTVVRRS